jgi:hypothetical protein
LGVWQSHKVIIVIPAKAGIQMLLSIRFKPNQNLTKFKNRARDESHETKYEK